MEPAAGKVRKLRKVADHEPGTLELTVQLADANLPLLQVSAAAQRLEQTEFAKFVL
jgi:hypothetical protein